MSSVTSVAAVVLAWRDEPWLEHSVGALLASTGVDVEVVLVDNGCTSGAVERLAARPGVVVVRPGRNLGFAGGCNAGAAVATADVLALVNADAVVAPGALAALAAVATEPGVGIATGSIRLAEDPARLNSAGNPLHYLGLVWAGGFGVPAAGHPARTEVPLASGAGCALRRQLWRELGGFAAEYFAYHEDAELSWRCRQRGLSVVYVPDAVVVHRYEFSRTPAKQYLLERNRWLFVLTLYGPRTLLVLAPALLAFEAAITAVAAVQGWLPAKLRGWAWLVRHAGWIRRRRALLQRERTLADRELRDWVTGRFDPANLPMPPGAGVAGAVLAAYWRLARRLL
ncbi:MAG TPA: glycosyltransferase [Mycobacteriales bacterium]